MCRFVLYLGEQISLGSLLTEPTNSIIHQSFHSHEREEPLNGDGFGVAWYEPEGGIPAVFKEISPAWNSLNLHNLARVTRSSCVLAHVRAASPGLPVIQLNCHPFSAGVLTFMHNGTLGGFRHLKRPLQQSLREETYLDIHGSTDTEHLFALIRESFDAASEEAGPTRRLASALVSGIRRAEDLRKELGIDEPSLLNLVLCDGKRAVATRYVSDPAMASNSLYLHQGQRYQCENGLCRMQPADSSSTSTAVIVASEPLSQDNGWQAVPENHLVSIDESLHIESVPIEL